MQMPEYSACGIGETKVMSVEYTPSMINVNGVRKYHRIQVPRKVRVEEWSGKTDVWVKNTHPYAFEINNRIKETLDLLVALNKRYYAVKKRLRFP